MGGQEPMTSSGTSQQIGRASQFVQYLCNTRPCPSLPAEAWASLRQQKLSTRLPLPLTDSAEPVSRDRSKLSTSTVSSCTYLAPSAGNTAEIRSSAPSIHFGGLKWPHSSVAAHSEEEKICAPHLHWSSLKI